MLFNFIPRRDENRLDIRLSFEHIHNGIAVVFDHAYAIEYEDFFEVTWACFGIGIEGEAECADKGIA